MRCREDDRTGDSFHPPRNDRRLPRLAARTDVRNAGNKWSCRRRSLSAASPRYIYTRLNLVMYPKPSLRSSGRTRPGARGPVQPDPRARSPGHIVCRLITRDSDPAPWIGLLRYSRFCRPGCPWRDVDISLGGRGAADIESRLRLRTPRQGRGARSRALRARVRAWAQRGVLLRHVADRFRHL